MKNRHSFFLFVVLLLSALVAHAQKTEPVGFYYDKLTKKYFSDGKSSFTIQAVETKTYLEKIEVSINDGNFKPYKGKLKFDKEGLHTVRFRALDPVHNWSPVQVFGIYVDMSPPVTKWNWRGETHKSENRLYVNSTAKLSVSAEDALSGVATSYMKDEGGHDISLKDDLTFKTAGLQTLRFYSRDNVGNVEPVRELSLFIDDQAPKTEVSIEGAHHKVGGNLFSHYYGNLTLRSGDDGAGVQKIEYQINNGPLLTYSVPLPVSEKKIILTYRAIDWVGNMEEWKTITVLQDSTPPQLALEEVGTFVNIRGKLYAKPGFSLKAKAVDTESGLKALLLSRDGGKEFQPTTDEVFKFNESGEYTLNLRAVDQIGNYSEANPITLVIDTTAPISEHKFTDHSVSKEDRILAGLPNRLEIVSHDDGVGVDYVEYGYDGKTFTRMQDPIDLSSWKESTREVYYRAVDRLGNQETSKKIKVELLTRGPLVDLFVESEDLPNVPLSKLSQDAKEVPAVTPLIEQKVQGANSLPTRTPAKSKK